MDTGQIKCNLNIETCQFRDKKCKNIWQSTAVKDKKKKMKKMIDLKQRKIKVILKSNLCTYSGAGTYKAIDKKQKTFLQQFYMSEVNGIIYTILMEI